MGNKKPIIGITMGDPSGNGPELCVKALTKPDMEQKCYPVVIGDARVIERAAAIVGHPEVKINPISSISEANFAPGTINVFHMDLIDFNRFEFGKVSAMCGNAAFQSVVKVIDLALKKEIDATVTNALNKEAINLAGFHYNGHTEIFAEYTGTKKYTMMLAYQNLRVVHVSTHVSLRKACDMVRKERVADVIRIAYQGCKDLGINEPRIGVAGLNPHAGENGLFGTEEIEEIIPAINTTWLEGIKAEGPVPPDTIFSKARGGWYDVVVCMYHDQGHIPIKVIGFNYNSQNGKWDAVEGVNITLGLPIIRTSVDHGTGFGHAGQGVANEASLVNAIDYAVIMAQNKKCRRN
ncbi:MAG TPA: 4-hydroxythreonine-4-phosphate dehydrogenase PdxA [Sedimentibacter sp.]|jgi:4-hydroxythreonine-4-phosphate dehydrogenase|nr:4-hydroxythreonine-4-phosphate dehydrogenase PdxA [Sedimentibacter sp.]HHZ00631.1 4-hydroxythreonine-4-phosphate dehydrogenase PdxA [Tissierellia bacterium]HOK49614.1 4-hydroxythreonine-4-phosphate dehydrogenase PdxA [Sedimentibacter sp.]HOW23744.1 4-hydroxythreonine-4-phosphate dehydrogenase PdxA [Sedimentibacter sp.]HRC79861.1 4-hydroxythreonine-4-phosphate dehydrogenase PdxA [Sedimentibacter sp.]